jgi:hypothetical protein
MLSVKECGVHVYSSNEEDTPAQRNLGADHRNAVNKELVILMLLDIPQGVALSGISNPAIQ